MNKRTWIIWIFEFIMVILFITLLIHTRNFNQLITNLINNDLVVTTIAGFLVAWLIGIKQIVYIILGKMGLSNKNLFKSNQEKS